MNVLSEKSGAIDGFGFRESIAVKTVNIRECDGSSVGREEDRILGGNRFWRRDENRVVVKFSQRAEGVVAEKDR